ncbi:M23 family metallopeptidase, partial [Agromyces allii]
FDELFGGGATAPQAAPAPAPAPAPESSRRARRAFDQGAPTQVPSQSDASSASVPQIPTPPQIPTAAPRSAPLSIPAASTEISGLDIFGLQADGALAGEAEPTAARRPHHPASRQPAASARSSRRSANSAAAGASAPHQGRRRSTAETPARADAAVRSAPNPQRRRARGIASIVAMSFVAMLAVTTTIPALSLLTEDDVQALALSQYGTDSIDGQRMLINGDVVAQSVDREGYASQTIEEYAEAAGIRPEATFTNNPSGTIQWPFAVGVHIGDRFGYRDCAGCSEDHHGQDFNPGYGAEIQAIADGVVSGSTDEGGSLGVVTMIDHQIDGQTVTSVYAHMQYDSRRFEIGDTVHVGDVVGNTGNTGMSTGPHLHFEIRIGGINGEWVDPLEWLYANTN